MPSQTALWESREQQRRKLGNVMFSSPPQSDDMAVAAVSAQETALPGFSPLQRGIGLRLLAYIILFSTVVTLLSTLAELYFDYRRDVGAIEQRMLEVERTSLESLAGSLWNVDTVELHLQLEGLQRLPDMQMVELRETGSLDKPVNIRIGVPASGAVISRDLQLYHGQGAQRHQIGVLTLTATLSSVYSRLLDTAVVILLSQGIKTFLVSMFTLYLVYRLVTRHLISIAAYLDRYDLRKPVPRLVLDRRAPMARDEFDRVVDAFNGMCSGLQDAYGELSHLNGELQADIRARLKAEEEVRHLNSVLELRVRQRTAELEAANKELGSFTYSVSHDLRAPLRRIEGFGQILADEYVGSIDERGQHYIRRIRAGANDMGEMIDSFLKLSRSTRGELAIEQVNLSALAADTIDQLREKEPDRQIEVNIQPDVGVQGDRRLLRVVLENLLENAWKYSRKADKPMITFGATNDAGGTVFFVRDNGVGFDMANANRLFIPFNRLHKAEDFEGSGIGLATVQRILARHGGRVWATAAPGRGATFHFTCWEGKSADEQS
ncbi:MAG TPA: ATP-binding protein [Candidatus Sulfotelmatobacter sp.]|nr:ATP-binding protein [Candidatus Sulfotelmatobacter sp.]